MTSELRHHVRDPLHGAGFDYAPVPLALISLRPDDAGRLVEVNSRFTDFSGVAAAEIARGADLQSLLTLSGRTDLHFGLHELAVRQATTWQCESRLRSRDGTHVPTLVSLCSIGTDAQPEFASVALTPLENSDPDPEGDWDGPERVATDIDVGMALCRDSDLSFLYVNSAFYSIFGLDPEGPWPTAQSVTSLMHPDDRDRYREAFARSGEQPVKFEVRLQHGLAPTRWLSLSLRRLAGNEHAEHPGSEPVDAGAPPHASGQLPSAASTEPRHILLVEEVTRQRRAEAAFRDGDARLQLLASRINVGFTLRTLGIDEFFYVSPAYLRILGFAPDAAWPAPSAAAQMVHADDIARVAAESAGISVGDYIDVEFRMIRLDGEVRWVRVTAAPIMDEHGVVVQLAGTVEDITAKMQTELALRESEQRFAQLAANLDVGVALRQMHPAQFLYVSPAFARIVGVEVADFFADSMTGHAVVHPEDRQRVNEGYWQDVLDGRPALSEHRIIRPDGQLRWLRASSSPVHDQNGEVVRSASTIQDITAQMLAQESARLAQAEAERANAAKNEFLSRMSHELRTPLNAVLGFGQLLELDDLTDEQSEAVRHILRGGRHLLSMINDVLDISRIESDQLEISLEAVRVGELLTDTVGLMRPIADEAGISVSLELAADQRDLHVRGDRRRLQQALLNLVSNAVKYNRPQGTVHIRVTTSADELARIEVIDSGAGISVLDLPRLFTPFDRLGQQDSGIEGTGIGLALTRRLVTMMGGEIDVVSDVGVGSTFSITVPIVSGPADGFTADSARLGAAAAAVGPDRTVLYIEDNPSNVELMERILQFRPAWKMLHAGNGSLGLDLARTTAPTLVLLDLNLPDMKGVDILAALMADPATARLPVVVVSADASPRQVDRVNAAGARRYLTKPLDVSDVLQVLDEPYDD